ncbi:prolyl oligopeptidase family serine peptidase [Silvibacterium acidisoli]|uniref:prolyl oligopeptidase family serine peptidase n=1 Tax=Acidobacteriaceae bacterium ZG23-2 TaxID=2883246 RepID=UPI00406C0E95
MKTPALLLLAAISASVPAVAAVTRENFTHAADLQKKYHGLATKMATEAHWVEDEHVLLYGENDSGKLDYYLYDADAGKTTLAFDRQKIAAALSSAMHDEVKPDDLPIHGVELRDHHTKLHFLIGYNRWNCDLTKYTCQRPHDDDDQPVEDPNLHPETRNSHDHQSASPDGKWKAMVLSYNVVLQSSDGKQTINLSTDGSEGNYYDLGSLSWSPDSKHLAVYRIRPGYRRILRFVESSPKNQLQPLYPETVYTKPGDVLDLQQPVLFDIASHNQTNIDNTLFPNPFDLSSLDWWKDSRGFTFEYNQRGHQLYRVIEVDATTGKARTRIDEPSDTFVDYRRLIPSQQDTGKIYRHEIDDGKEIIWASERDGWEHLYLLDGATGAIKNQITHGEWVVRSVDRVDEKNRVIWFSASGRHPDEDPYFVHAYRINFDGSNLTELTPSAGNHTVNYSSDGTMMADLVSTVENPPILSIAHTEGTSQPVELLHGDVTKLKAAGWAPPEPFHAKGRDGKTEIWGVVYKPAHFDPKAHYPVIEDIYAGPQGSFVPKSFTTRAQPLTELGFVVVQIDGMGTNNRSKAFHNVAWKNLKDAGFPDRILWHKAYAATHPWYDITRVGIFGTSAGGQNAMGALLFHPEFYKVAVANSGCHDNRMDKIWWNEQWMSWPIGPQYSESSNVDNAWRLQGKLMLVVGELDDNVDPSSTFQVADRLEKADKDFDLLYVPGGKHGAGGAYGQRKLQSFFVRNLLGEPVPSWNEDTAKNAPQAR